ncbi:MAG: hypothetical protein DYH14_13880 [Betaproteobacteria bacterium PRO3]|nr:hypothetical protein [Betaproteobacteria bacterium PRO3]
MHDYRCNDVLRPSRRRPSRRRVPGGVRVRRSRIGPGRGQGVPALQGGAPGRDRQEDRGDRVLLLRLPALRGPRAAHAGVDEEAAAKVYYTLEALGEDAKLTPEVFLAIHGPARDNLAKEDKFFDWAAKKGLDRKKVEEIYKSFGVSGKVGRAKQIAQAYNIQSVPTIIVDGKFQLTSGTAGGHPNVPATIDAAIAVARAERPKS